MNEECLLCEAPFTRRWQKKFCSNKCQADYRYSLFKKGWLSSNVDVLTINTSGHIRRYLLEQNGEKCWECSWNKRNIVTGRVPLEVDHRDGNATNNKLKNLRLICPNCHSLTASFRALNKGKGRAWRKGSMQANASVRQSKPSSASL